MTTDNALSELSGSSTRSAAETTGLLPNTISPFHADPGLQNVFYTLSLNSVWPSTMMTNIYTVHAV